VSKRVDALIAKHPDRAEAIDVLASRDPAGNLKYLNWQMKVLLAGRALAPEIADVVDLFHNVGRNPDIRPDLYSYRPQDFTILRDKLFVIQKTRQRKQAKIEKRFRLVGDIDSEVVYESPTLIVRLIKNKNASVHFGLGTKWCISMKNGRYYEDYESENTAFFFVRRKQPVGDSMDSVAVSYTLNLRNVPRRSAYYSAVDEPVNEMVVIQSFGPEFFDVQRIMYDRIRKHPMSPTTMLLSGMETTPETLAAIYETAKVDAKHKYVHDVLLAIACNAGASAELLTTLRKQGPKLLTKTHAPMRPHRPRRWLKQRAAEWCRDLMAAIYVHPSLPEDVRDELGKSLRRRNVRTTSIETLVDNGHVSVMYKAYRGTFLKGRSLWRRLHARRRRLHARRRNSPAALQRHLNWHKRGVIRLRKRLAKAKKRERAEAKKREAEANKRKVAKK
jgi:hypothetical protein